MHQPIKKFRVGSVEASVWKKTIEYEGTTKTIYETTIKKNYKDKQDEWQSTNNYSVGELSHVQQVTRLAQDWIYHATTD